ncbi:MAG: tetratricopeptide repeat protein [Leptospiraceae bacterium]|nr:tetratricopeptide repeat protein [Leptospiraceae bacterium]
MLASKGFDVDRLPLVSSELQGMQISRTIMSSVCGSRLLAFLFMAAMAGAHCSAAIRKAPELKQDHWFIWTNSANSGLDPGDLIEQSARAEDFDSLNDRALALIKLGRIDQAERIFYEILAQGGPTRPAALNLGRLYAILGESARLRQIDDRLILANDSDKDKWYQTARTLAGQNRMTEARVLQESLFEGARYIPAGLWLADQSLADGQYPQALALYEAVLSQDPGSHPALFASGWIHLQAGNWVLAREYFSEAVRRGSTEEQIHYYLAQSWFAEEAYTRALQAMQTRLNPADYDQVALYGQILLKLEFNRDLRPLLKKIQNPDDQKSLLRLWYGTDSQWLWKMHPLLNREIRSLY